MNIIVTMTKDEKDRLPKLSPKRIRELESREIVYDDDCPRLGKDELSEFRPCRRIGRAADKGGVVGAK